MLGAPTQLLFSSQLFMSQNLSSNHMNKLCYLVLTNVVVDKHSAWCRIEPLYLQLVKPTSFIHSSKCKHIRHDNQNYNRVTTLCKYATWNQHAMVLVNYIGQKHQIVGSQILISYVTWKLIEYIVIGS